MFLPSLRRGLVVVCGLIVATLSATSAFAQNTITGTVTRTDGGATVANVRVQLISSSNGFQVTESPLTGANGVFTVSNVSPGSYYLRTSNSSGLINRVRGASGTVVYAGGSLVGGTYQGQSAIVVGGNRTGENFALNINLVLAPGGSITGTVTNASTSAVVQNVSLNLYSEAGTFLKSTQSNASGVYSLGGLPAANYRVRTTNSLGFINEAYDNIACENCSNTTGALIAVGAGATVSGRNFALEPGATVSGTITNAAGGANLSGVTVNVYSSAGVLLKSSAPTGAAGTYSVTGLPAGDHRVRTSNSSGFIDEAHNDIPCLNCSVTLGDPVTLTAGATSTINFGLTAGATVSGTVINAVGGANLNGVTVNVYSSTGTLVKSGTTNASGVYSVVGLQAGQHRVRTSNNAGFIDEAHNDLACFNCTNTFGDLITLSAGATNTINFALTPGATVSGTITNAAGGANLSGVSVNVYSSAGVFLKSSAPTGAAGTYSVTGLPAGAHRVRTSNSAGFIDEAHNDIPCLNCSNTLGDLITLTAGGTNTINFALTAGATVSGTVTNANGGANLNGVTVDVYSSTGTLVKSGTTNASGVYSVVGLQAGQHRVRTSNNQGFIDEAYNDIACLSCSNTTGELITLSSGATAANINFALTPGATVSGTITNAAGGANLSGVSVNVYSSAGVFLKSSAPTGAAGTYSVTGLPAGAHRARTSNSAGFIDEAHNDIPCLSCSFTLGDLITLTAGATNTINFALTAGATVSGTVTNSSGGAALNLITVNVYSSTGTFVKSGTTNASGVYAVAGLQAGQHRVRTSNNAGFIDEAHNDIPCFNCTNTLGDLITLVSGQTNTINFALTPGATVSGTITNSSGGAAIEFISVSVYSSTGTFLKGSSTNASGVYSVTGLPAGQHRAKTSNSIGFIDEAYNNITCLSCSTTTGELITLTAGAITENISFALVPGGTITGTVTSSSGGAAIASVSMNIVDASNLSIGKFATTNASGVYSFTGMPAGTFYIRTSNGSGFIDEAYDNLPCSNCNSTAGTGVVVATGATVPNINFALTPGARISGTVTNAATEVAVQGVSVSFYNGTGQFVGSASTDALGAFSSSGLQPGTYFANTTSNSAGLINKLFDNVSCNNCPVTSGTAIVLAAGDLFTTANFALAPGGRISGVVTSLASGLPITTGGVSILNAAGSQVASASLNFTTGAFETSGLAPGTYYAKSNVFSGGFINLLYAGKICVNCNVAEVGTAVVVTGTATTPNINFALPTGGNITGTLTDGSNAGVAGVSVEVYDGTSFVTSSGPSAANGTYTISGLSAGNFYVRTRSSNGYIAVIYDGATGTMCLGCTHATTGTLVPVTVGATTSGINMRLTLGGQITGTVTNASTTAPISSLSVTLTDGAGTFLNGAQTNGSGVFTFTGLPAATYYLRTSNSQGFIDELFDNIPCSGFCGNAVGTPIVLTTGGTQTANMSLVPGGKIGGRVTNASGQPLGHTSAEPVSVSIYNGTGLFITSATTNDAGNYLTSVGLPAGTYFARVNATGYIGELYDNVLCTSCFVTGGAAITVTAGATTTGIDFSLAQGGRVTGRILDSDGNGIEGVRVNLTDVATFASGGSGTTTASGVYSVFGVPTGTYVAKTSNSVGFIDEIYNNIKCTTCSVTTTGQQLAVAAGQTVANIDFGLDRGGRITGRVTNASNTTLSGVSITVFDSLDKQVTNTFTNFDGTYATSGLVPGQYFVRTTNNNFGLVNELYNDLPCLSCLAGSGTPVVIDTTETEGNINFSLAPGGSISGRVADAGNGSLANVRVDIYDGNNRLISGVSTLSNGTYTVGGLQTGTYYAKTFNTRGLIDKLYNDVACVACSVTGGAPIAVTVGSTTANINFVLAVGGGISGTITDLEGGTLGGVSLQVFSGNGQFLQNLSTDGLGRYATTVGLVAGRYFVRTNTTLGYVNELYDNVPCSNCPVTGGTAVIVAGSAVTTDINFTLAVGGSITGTVTSSTGTPLENITVTAFLPSGVSAGNGFTNSLGVFRLSGMPSGPYFLKTNNSRGFIDELYDGRVCTACNPTTGTPVAVLIAQTTSNINFSLEAGGRISGTVTAAGTTTPIPGVVVEVFSSAGTFVTTGVTDGLGRYSTGPGLATGTYYARSSNANGYVDEVYDNTTCTVCNATIGQPITVTAGATTLNINFGLVLGGRISGTVAVEGTTTPIPNARVDVFTSTGAFAGTSTSGTNGRYLTGTGLPTGNYYVKVSSPQGHISEVFNNVSCSACSPITGTALAVTAGATTTGTDFSLALGGLITGTITETSTGVQLRDITVLVFNANNNLVSTARSDASGRFTSGSGLPAGTYYAKTTNNQGFVDKAYNDIICLAGCKAPVVGAGIVVAAGLATNNIDFSLARGGRIAGTVTDVATTLPLASSMVRIFDTAGKFVSAGRTDNAGNYLTQEGLPTGTYFARTDNGLGYVDKLYNDELCMKCDPTRGAPIAVTAGATTSAINFALSVGGGVAGAITNESTGLPLANIKVALYTLSGSLLGGGTTDGAGRFDSGLGLAPGQYFMRTFNLLGFVDEAFNNRACAPCPITESTAITVTAGATRTGVDFALAVGGLVSGYVTDGATNAPLEGVTVSFFTNPAGVFVGRSEPSDSTGYYAISLPVGTYQVQADPKDGYAPTASVGRGRQVGFALGTVTVNLGQETTGVTFPLEVCQAPVLSPLTLGLLTKGMAYTRTLSATGTGPFTFSIAEGLLPPGLTLNEATGVLSGTPTALGTANFTLAASGAASCPGTQTYAQLTCGITLTQGSASISSTAGTGAAALTADETDCAWAATSNTSWITVTSGTGAGNGSVALSFAANPAQTARVGTVTIASETFTVTQAAAPDVVPSITTHPSSVTITRGANASFTAAGDGLPVPTLQWQVSTDAGASYANVPNAAPYSGVTSGTLTITAAPAGLNGARYRAVATNVAGTANSNAATLTVNGDLTMTPSSLQFTAVKAGAAGAILTVSAAQTVTVASTGAGPAWTAASNQSWLQITNGTGTGAGTFSASIVNPGNVIGASSSLTATITLTAPTAGSTTTVAVTLTVDFVPSITTHPSSVAITRGANASFTVAAAGLPVPTMQWQISTDAGVTWSNLSNAAPYSGVTTGTLTITAAPVGLNGARYRAVATSSPGVANSNAATLTVYGDLSMTPGTLRFTAVKAGAAGAISNVSAPQQVTVLSTGAGPAWTAASNQSWLQITNGTGAGAATFSASIVNPANVIGASPSLTATITLTAPTAGSTTTVTVVLTVQQPGENAGPIGQVDTPLQNANGVTGAFGVTGWALDDLGVTSVRIYRECLGMDIPANCHQILGRRVVLVGEAAFLPGARPDVEAIYPTYPRRHVAGWGMQILSNSLPHLPNGQPFGGQGPMTLYVVATDLEGNMKLLGRSSDPASADYAVPTSLTLANDSIAKPFGTIDTPAPGATVSGSVANFGWVLTPDANTTAGDTGDILMATSGSGIVVYVDGLPVSLVAYNQCRGTVGNPVPAGAFCNDDVASIFGNATPQASLTPRTSNPTRYRNLDAARSAIGAYVLNTTSLTNGLHTIAWGVADSAGRTEGIGSRFFTVLNVSSDQAAQTEAPAAMARSAAEGVHGRTGYGLDGAWKRMFADSSGAYAVRLAEGGRLELTLGAPVDAGYLIANGQRQALPVGATLNGGHFAWMPPLGYVGPYMLTFVRADEHIDVQVTVAPVAQAPAGQSEIRMNLDPVLGAECSVLSAGCGLRVQGWAFDPQASIESGIGAVHVWAKRLVGPGSGVLSPGSSTAPVFLGAATLDVARPDVAGAIAGAPSQAGYQLSATLGTGTWEVTAYVWNERTARWEDARTTTVTIR